jgi:membrane-associated HD superfamily phosphohydrolase
LMMGLCVLVIALFLPKQARFSFEYEKGKIWLHKDLVSPYTYAIKKTSEELKKDQEGILGAVNPVYQNNAEIVESELETFATNFEIQWKNSGEEFNEKEGIKKIAIQILEDIYSRGVINRNKKFQHLDSNYNFSLLTDNVLSSLNTLDAFTIAGARKYALARATAIRTLEKKSWLVTLLMDHVEANYIYDERLTNKAEEEALASISPSTGMVQKGELIIATDNMITPEAFQKLESLREVYEQDALIIGDRKFVFAGQFFGFCLIPGLHSTCTFWWF